MTTDITTNSFTPDDKSGSYITKYPLSTADAISGNMTNYAVSSDAVSKAGRYGASFIGDSEFQSVYSTGSSSGSSFAPEKTFSASTLIAGKTAQNAFGLPAFSATVTDASNQGKPDANGKLGADGIFAKTFGDSTKAGASYFDPQAWTKDFKLVAGNANAYTVQATSDDGKKVVTVTEVANGKDPYGVTGPGANGSVRETVVITGSDNDKFVGAYASDAVNVVDASTIVGSSVDVLNTSRATNYVNVNKGIASAYKETNTHSYKEANGVQALSDAQAVAYNYKDKGLTIIDSHKSASNSVNYATLDKATLVANSANNYYYDNSNPANAVKVQYTKATTHTYNKTAATTFKDVVTTNLVQYKLSDNTNLDGLKIDAKGIITATTTDAAATAFAYTNPALTISNNAYQLTVKTFATTANGLGGYENKGNFAAQNGLNVAVVSPKVPAIAADAANGIVAVPAKSAVTSITGTINNDEIKVVIPVDKTTGLNASDTINKGTTTGGTANGGAGNDTIIGGALDDVLTGDAGADVLTGGAGKDTFIYDEFDIITDLTAAEVGLLQFVPTSKFDANKATALPVTLLSTTDKDSSVGETVDLADVPGSKSVAYNVTGTDKNDNISGHLNADILSGGKGDDVLNGSGGNDVLNGGDGADTLTGGKGADKLTGGKGADLFKFTELTSGATPEVVASKTDTITDFSAKDADKIDLSAIDVNRNPVTTKVVAPITVSGKVTNQAAIDAANKAIAAEEKILDDNQSFKFIGSAAFDAKDATAQLRYDFDAVTKTVTLQASNNTDATPEFTLKLTGITDVTAADFIGVV